MDDSLFCWSSVVVAYVELLSPSSSTSSSSEDSSERIPREWVGFPRSSRLRFAWGLRTRFDDRIGRAPNCSKACFTASWRTSTTSHSTRDKFQGEKRTWVISIIAITFLSPALKFGWPIGGFLVVWMMVIVVVVGIVRESGACVCNGKMNFLHLRMDREVSFSYLTAVHRVQVTWTVSSRNLFVWYRLKDAMAHSKSDEMYSSRTFREFKFQFLKFLLDIHGQDELGRLSCCGGHWCLLYVSMFDNNEKSSITWMYRVIALPCDLVDDYSIDRRRRRRRRSRRGGMTVVEESSFVSFRGQFMNMNEQAISFLSGYTQRWMWQCNTLC